MRVLVIGSGGREHALSYKISQHHEVICAPGNPGIGWDVDTAPIDPQNAPEILRLCRSLSVDLVVVGPEDPLIMGLADILREAGIPTFGPGSAGARLEGSKAFSKELMAEANVPTANYRSFSEYASAVDYARRSFSEGVQLAVKASGNALGRGVVVCETFEQAEAALNRMMIDREFGASGDTVVLEERLVGREFSLLTIVGEQNYVHLPIAQDYKRARDGDEGPNTGGMGSFSPCTWASPDLIEEVDHRMVAPILASFRSQGISFRGTLFTGVMVTPNGPKCLEYNVRFGDPETQTIMMRIGGDLGSVLYEAATGAVIPPVPLTAMAAVTVIVASSGYPGVYQKNCPISIGDQIPDTKLFFAGVAGSEDHMVTSGGRVVGASALAKTVAEARSLAYRAAQTVHFEGAYFRRDIASGETS